MSGKIKNTDSFFTKEGMKHFVIEMNSTELGKSFIMYVFFVCVHSTVNEILHPLLYLFI